MFEPVVAAPVLDDSSCKAVQKTSRHGRVPHAIVLHSTGSGRAPESIVKAVKVNRKSSSWHTVLDDETRINLISYSDASCSNPHIYNLRTINIGVCLNDSNWERLIRSGKVTNWVYHIAYACFEANRYLNENYSRNIPAKRIGKTEFKNGLPGFLTHDDLDGSGCFVNSFPWHDFLRVYDRLCFPQKVTINKLVAEASAVAESPGAIASALMKDYDQYEQVGAMLVKALPEKMIIKNVFHRFAGREAEEEELMKLLELADSLGLEPLIELIAREMACRSSKPSNTDLKLHRILSTAFNCKMVSGGLGNGLDC